MRNVRRDAMTILLLLVSGFGCTTIPRNAGPPPAVPSTPPLAMAVASLPPPAESEKVAQPPPPAVLPLPQEGEARTREPTPSQASGMETASLTPAPLAVVDLSKGGSVPSHEPLPEVPSTTPPATAVALLPPPAKSEEVAQPPPPTFLPIPQEEEARTREPTPSQASGMETAATAPAPLAAVDLSKGGSVAFPEPPPAVPSTPPPATDPLRLEEERLSATKSYRIGPEDVLHVSVWNNPELTIDVTVRPDGKISLPLIKDIHAADSTPKELSDVIFRSLKEYIYNPHVTVTVTQANSRKIFLIGNVIRPGSYMLRYDMTVLQALSLAGGFTQFASPRDMKLIRDVGGKQESRSINYYKMIKDSEVDDYMLKPGDTIVIP